MPKLIVLSGNDLIKIFQQFDFSVTSRKESHIKISRFKDGEKQVLVFPNHNSLNRGSLKAIYRQTLSDISESKVKKYIYHD